MGAFDYRRRPSREVNIGGVRMGGDNPIRIQSMTNTSTMDTEGSVAQTKRIADAGADYVRLTAQGVREGENLGKIREKLRQSGENVPLIADIHFNPRAAWESAQRVEKVRINPGNFVDPGRVFKQLEYTDEQYASELQRIRESLVPFYEFCREHGTVVRIGVNHGSLSDRIMSRYGDTPAGMVESAMEFLRVAKSIDFNDLVISMKASNTVVMVESVRRLVRAMDAEGMDYPLHLGVTEAGDGEDGRVKSAVGIGTLLAEGIGDTIRVSLSEPPEDEVPVAIALRDYITARSEAPSVAGEMAPDYNPVTPSRRKTERVGIIGGVQPQVVVGSDPDAEYEEDSRPDIFGTETMTVVDAGIDREALLKAVSETPGKAILLKSGAANPVAELQAAIHDMDRHGLKNPVVACLNYDGLGIDDVTLRAAADFGTLLLNGAIDGVMIEADGIGAAKLAHLAFGILQAARCRITRTEFISCPGCGRTLFDLQSTVKTIKEATSHLKGLKLGIMGCIVNGPGEMADADYGYVGAAAGHVSLYRGKECVAKNIPAAEALDRLIELLKADGKWSDR